MDDRKKLGFWKEFSPASQLPSLFDQNTLVKREEPINKKILDYLKSGVWLSSIRTAFYCPVTDERIGTPSIYTDGEWVWTSEYIYYIDRYNFKIPDEFLDKMSSKNFLVPTKEELGEKLIDALDQEMRHYSYR